MRQLGLRYKLSCSPSFSLSQRLGRGEEKQKKRGEEARRDGRRRTRGIEKSHLQDYLQERELIHVLDISELGGPVLKEVVLPSPSTLTPPLASSSSFHIFIQLPPPT